MNIPNTLTAVRIVLMPVLVIVFFMPLAWAPLACAAIFALAAATDWADGYLARRLSQVSTFGAFLDPVADKLMVAIALVLIVQRDPVSWIAIPAAVIISREIVVSALRELMAELGQRATVSVATIGKVKTACQMTSLVLLLYHHDLGPIPTFPIGTVLLYVATVLTLWSMVVYLRIAWPVIMAGESRLEDSDRAGEGDRSPPSPHARDSGRAGPA